MSPLSSWRMSVHFRCAALGITAFLSATTTALAQGAPPKGQSAPADSAKLFTAYTAETFRTLPAAEQQITFEQIDDDLLSAAVFHETNKRRQPHGLPALRHEPRVRAAAQMQAEHMAALGVISHENTVVPTKATPADRLRVAGLKPGFVSENVGTAFGVTYKNGEQAYPREENGKKFLSREPAGAAIPPHTYLSFAAAWLDDLMASPLHRDSIISPKPIFLGVSCRLKINELGMPLFHGVQKFYAPPIPNTP